MIENAQVNGKKEQEDYFTALLKCLKPDMGEANGNGMPVSPSILF